MAIQQQGQSWRSMKFTFLSHRLFPLAVAGGLLFPLVPLDTSSSPPPFTIRTSISSTGEEIFANKGKQGDTTSGGFSVSAKRPFRGVPFQLRGSARFE
jgi:hypothetical protein